MANSNPAKRIYRSITIDFQDSKYISINAKQYDKFGREIEVTCTNLGEIIKIDHGRNYAYLRYRRVDGIGFIEPCQISKNGTILVTLSKRMLDCAGKCYADIIIVESDTTRVPLSENGFFIVDYIYDEEKQSLQPIFYPNVNTQFSEGVLTMDSIIHNGKNINICNDPSPFVVGDQNGVVTFAYINEEGEIMMINPSIMSTMTFCINVIDSSFYGNCIEIMR